MYRNNIKTEYQKSFFKNFARNIEAILKSVFFGAGRQLIEIALRAKVDFYLLTVISKSINKEKNFL